MRNKLMMTAMFAAALLVTAGAGYGQDKMSQDKMSDTKMGDDKMAKDRMDKSTKKTSKKKTKSQDKMNSTGDKMSTTKTDKM